LFKDFLQGERYVASHVYPNVIAFNLAPVKVYLGLSPRIMYVPAEDGVGLQRNVPNRQFAVTLGVISVVGWDMGDEIPVPGVEVVHSHVARLQPMLQLAVVVTLNQKQTAVKLGPESGPFLPRTHPEVATVDDQIVVRNPAVPGFDHVSVHGRYVQLPVSRAEWTVAELDDVAMIEV